MKLTEKKDKMRKKIPLRWSMTGMLVLGWLLPLVLIALSLIYFVSSMVGSQIDRTIRISTDKAVEICEMQLGEILTASKMASYNSTIRDAYQDYSNEGKARNLYDSVTNFMRQQYKYDRNFLCAMCFFLDNPEEIYYTYNTYQDNNTGFTGYNRIAYFRDNILGDVIDVSRELDTKTVLMMRDRHFYIVRNLVDSTFQPYSMIVIELSPGFVFESLNSVLGAIEYEVYLDGMPLMDSGFARNVDVDAFGSLSREQSVYRSGEDGSYACRTIGFEGQELKFVVKLDPAVLIDDVKMLRWVVVLVLIFMIPLMIMIFRFFYVKVTKPVEGLIGAAGEIAAGNYGHQVDQNGNSREFEYLDNAFNAMSIELKYQFEQIYLEELALRDANIMALQSQINPHFLNNTLEIINWEARLNGNDKVSNMIEALATMLNATMNRKQKRFVPLSEELSYVDAYLYIIGQRFGEHFRVEREIDRELLEVQVPLLIIQPIVENAVEHGMRGRRDGCVRLHIYSKREEKKLPDGGTDMADGDDNGERMYVEIVNNGALSPEDQERIDYLLGDTVQNENEHHVSLGIRNVDRRLKIIYGEACGLTIKSDNENQTVSTIIVKINKEHNKSQ